MFSTSEGYHDASGGIKMHVEDIMSTLGDIMCTLGDIMMHVGVMYS